MSLESFAEQWAEYKASLAAQTDQELAAAWEKAFDESGLYRKRYENLKSRRLPDSHFLVKVQKDGMEMTDYKSEIILFEIRVRTEPKPAKRE